jgi:hypothetical protein
MSILRRRTRWARSASGKGFAPHLVDLGNVQFGVLFPSADFG